mmetsp:Transcript_20382/g.44122  ORF Transcript_20382/g.44122 Transcript_20382/m.44122 type:complete len:298 (+) Transcript_20382:307-1200(+)
MKRQNVLAIHEIDKSVPTVAPVFKINGQIKEINDPRTVAILRKLRKKHLLRVFVGDVPNHERCARIPAILDRFQVQQEMTIVLVLGAGMVGVSRAMCPNGRTRMHTDIVRNDTRGIVVHCVSSGTTICTHISLSRNNIGRKATTLHVRSLDIRYENLSIGSMENLLLPSTHSKLTASLCWHATHWIANNNWRVSTIWAHYELGHSVHLASSSSRCTTKSNHFRLLPHVSPATNAARNTARVVIISGVVSSVSVRGVRMRLTIVLALPSATTTTPTTNDRQELSTFSPVRRISSSRVN